MWIWGIILNDFYELCRWFLVKDIGERFLFIREHLTEIQESEAIYRVVSYCSINDQLEKNDSVLTKRTL